MKRIIALLLASFLSSVPLAQADPILNYNYLEGGYQWNELNGQNVESANGVAVKGSVVPIDYFFLEGSYEYYATKINDVNMDQNLFKAGLGVWEPLTDNLDLVGRGGGVFSEPGGDLDGESDSGAYGGVEFRLRTSPGTELDLYTTYTSDIVVNPAIETTNFLFGTNFLVRTGNHGALRFGFAMDEETSVILNLGMRITL